MQAEPKKKSHVISIEHLQNNKNPLIYYGGFSYSYFSYLAEIYSYYIHIPFCHRVCPYCKFAVSPVINKLTKKKYLEYLKKEIIDFFEKKNSEMGVRGEGTVWTMMKTNESKSEANVEWVWLPLETFGTFGHKSTEIGVWKNKGTLYFWWWTPSLLSIQELSEILQCFPFFQQSNHPTFQSSNIEITIEANPEDITEEKVKWWKGLWINRVSLWVQSLDNKVLDIIKRSDQKTILQALEILNTYLENINVDFILGLPYSKSWRTLESIKELYKWFPNITHTSVYILEDEHYPKEWKNHYLDNKDVEQEYAHIWDYLLEKWWNHYEVSNWAKPWYESSHNQSYWDHSNYRGFWLSASSCIDRERFSNHTSFQGYYRWGKDKEILTGEQIQIEKILFSLRTFSLDRSLIKNQWKLEEFLHDELLEIRKEGISPTKTWILLLDYIIGELV